jgi:hypothetical protein
MREKLEMTLQKIARADREVAAAVRSYVVDESDEALQALKRKGDLDWSIRSDLQEALPEDEAIAGMGEEDWRVVRLLAQLGHRNGLFSYWLYWGLDNEGDNDLFGAFLANMQKAGLSENELLAGMAHLSGYVLRRTGVTSLGRYALGMPEEKLIQLAQLINDDSPGEGLLELLLEHAPERAMPVFEALMAGQADEDDRAEFCAVVMKKDPERFVPPVVEALEELSELGPRLSLIRLLVDHDAERFGDQALELARACLSSTDYWDSRLKPEQILINVLGAGAVEEITAFVGSTGDESGASEAVALLAKKVGLEALPAIEAVLEKRPGSGRLRAADLLIGLDTEKQHTDTIRLRLLQGLRDADNDHYIGHFAELALTWDRAAMADSVWAAAEDKSKKVRDAVSTVLVKQTDAVERATALLAAKKAPTRETAVDLLIQLATESNTAAAALRGHLAREKSEKVKKKIFAALGEEAPAEPEEDLDTVIEKTVKKIKKPIASWLPETLPALPLTGGGTLDEKKLKFVLYQQSRTKGIMPDPDAEPLVAKIDRAQSGSFALELLEKMIGAGASAKDKWGLTVAGMLGDERVVPVLDRHIKEWANEGRGKMSEYAVLALALQGSDAALMAIDDASRRFANKYSNIGGAATAAFATAAERRGMPVDELADRIVPTLGFEAGKPRLIDAGGRSLEVRIGPTMKLQYYDVDKRKVVKSLPKGVDPAVKEELKGVAAAMRSLVKAQTRRLEAMFGRGHRWPSDRWQALFVEHPVLRRFGERLVWGAYQEGAKEGEELVQVFRALGDGTLTDFEENEVRLPESAQIGVLHPLEIDATARQGWLESLADYEIEQPFLQMARPIFEVSTEQQDKTLFVDHCNKTIDGYGFRSRSEKLGWYRGEVGDAGAIYTIHKDYPRAGITATLRVDNYGAMIYDDVTVQELYFERSNERKRWGYDAPLGNEETLVRFGAVPELVRSETVADLERVIGAG